MRILFLGDLVGRVGRTAVIEQLPELVESNQLDFVIVVSAWLTRFQAPADDTTNAGAGSGSGDGLIPV
ncbi:MAG: YmdB family metallophosphoesterase, partial [Pseudomonadota bacterium]|nr:YmdB family metallophosphoesterase [Pseudomonadota bacterium]